MDDQTQERIFELDINLLQANPLQPRGVISPESLNELIESIREQGILEPLVIARTPAGYQIIAGERRWRAAKILGLSKVPVVIKEATPQGMLEMSIVENVQREDLNPIERALAYKRLMLEMFKKILRENSTVRQTEDMARRAKSEVEKREPRTAHDRLWVPEMDEMEKELEKKHGFAKVTMYQSRSLARIVIAIRGDIDETTPKVKEIYETLMRVEPKDS